jgi:hypothetical protein
MFCEFFRRRRRPIRVFLCAFTISKFIINVIKYIIFAFILRFDEKSGKSNCAHTKKVQENSMIVALTPKKLKKISVLITGSPPLSCDVS